MDSSDSCSSRSVTTILDLNDDCLREVFKHLHVGSLCNVADVSIRFCQNAKESYKSSKHGHSIDIQLESESFEKESIQALKILRNFGRYIKSIAITGKYGIISEKQSKFQRRTWELLGLHCIDGALIKLSIYDYVITDEIAFILQPALAGLRQFELIRGGWEKLLTAAFCGVKGIQNHDIDEILMRIPQLKCL